MDNCAATPAMCTFRPSIILAAALDLELQIFDPINAFLNANLPDHEEVYCYISEVFGEQRMIVRLGTTSSLLPWSRRDPPTFQAPFACT